MHNLIYEDKKLINILSMGLPISVNPYKELAEEVGLTEEEILNRIYFYKKEGFIRRLGATLNHYKIGLNANAMSIWKVDKDKIDLVGNIMASYKEITHCYERQSYPHWPYNIYAMIHGRAKEDCERIAMEISRKTGIKDYKLLYSTREFKKTNLEYF